MVLLSGRVNQESENNCGLGRCLTVSGTLSPYTCPHTTTITIATSVSFVTLTSTIPLLYPRSPMKTEAVHAVVGSQLCFCQQALFFSYILTEWVVCHVRWVALTQMLQPFLAGITSLVLSSLFVCQFSQSL